MFGSLRIGTMNKEWKEPVKYIVEISDRMMDGLRYQYLFGEVSKEILIERFKDNHMDNLEIAKEFNKLNKIKKKINE